MSVEIPRNQFQIHHNAEKSVYNDIIYNDKTVINDNLCSLGRICMRNSIKLISL